MCLAIVLGLMSWENIQKYHPIQGLWILVSGSTPSPDKGETSKKRNRSTDDSGRGKGKAKKPLFDEEEEELLSCFESAAEETPQKGNEDGNESEEEYAVTYMQ